MLTAPALILIRHADVDAGGADPPLSAAGAQRAQELRHVLHDAGIDLILVTSLQRSQQTAAPLAADLGVAPTVVDPVADAVAAIRAHPSGSVVLVVGHTNTVPEIVAALGGPADVTIGPEEFDCLLVLAQGRLVRLRYGA